MEDWQKDLIRLNLPHLIKCTDTSTMLLAELIAMNILSRVDVAQLKSQVVFIKCFRKVFIFNWLNYFYTFLLH